MELYARAAEAFFKKGNGERVAFKPTWSWWAFFGQCWFFFFRKEYLVGFILFFIGAIIPFLPMIFCALFAKYKVIKNFEIALDRGSDESLELLGGRNTWAIWAPIAIYIISVIVVLTMIDFSNLENM